ncbi:MAG TPA: enolase C-terminal domain-like protein [Acidobacteriota bacterium]|nr:enolase C-terminal domain-like protein [Acidobacteriota bacterium]
MINVDTITVVLPLKKKFVVSKGEAEVKTNVITILNNRYIGEASGSVYSGPPLEVIEADVKAGVKRLQRKRTINLRTLYEIGQYDIHAVARSALTGMVLNYLSGESQRYPWEVLSLSTPMGIRNSMTVSLGTPDEVAAAVRESQYPILKVKMGGETDLGLVKAIADVTDKEIRVDANGGWSCEQAEEIIFYLAKQGITVIEQPTDIEHIGEWPRLKGKCEDVELILDEGLATMKDYRRYAEFIDGVNVKMEKSGGILEGIRIARAARADKKKVMLGCMVGTSIGIAQSVYMSSLADYFDLDGPQLLQDDIALGINYDRESIRVDREIIGGPKLKRDIVEKLSNE